MNPIEQQKRLLNRFIAAAGSWKAGGENDQALERQCDELLTQIHPDRRIALGILESHLNWEVAV